MKSLRLLSPTTNILPKWFDRKKITDYKNIQRYSPWWRKTLLQQLGIDASYVYGNGEPE